MKLQPFIAFLVSFSLVGLLACTTPGPTSSQRPSGTDQGPHPLAILQGASGPSFTQISVLHPASSNSRLKFLLVETGTTWARKPKQTTLHTRDFSKWAVTQVTFEGLRPDVTYRLEVRDAAELLIDSRELKTLDTFSRRPIHFMVASCMDDGYPREQKKNWEGALSQNPDFIFLIGDNVYADKEGDRFISHATPKLLWERYVSTFQNLLLYHWPKLIPTMTVWDDHDFGKNDADTSYPYAKESKSTFEAFFPREPIPGIFVHGPGVSSRFTGFGQSFYLMDDRSFRTRDSHWGPEQEQWLSQGLSALQNPVWLMNGDQFFGGYQPTYESFQRNHPKSFEKLLSSLKKIEIPVMFVSGDRHLIELMQIPDLVLGYQTFELTTSAIHAFPSQGFAPGYWEQHPNPYRIEGRADLMNYALIRVRRTAPWEFNISGYHDGNQLIFSRDLSVRHQISTEPKAGQ